jgi:hypothetical protein
VGAVVNVACAPALSLGFDPYKDNGATVANILTCIGAKEINYYDNDFMINVDENFVEALTSESDEVGLDWGGGVVATNPPPPPATDVTNGSNIVVTFSNVPATVGIVAEDMEPCSTLNTADPLYCSGGTLTLNTPTPTAVTAPAANGTAAFTYTVATRDSGIKESVTLSFKFWSHGPLPPGLPAMTVNIAYGPSKPTTDIPLFTGTPEYTTGMTVVTFSDCITNMLFPYINSVKSGAAGGAFGNFETGIAFANTTLDPYTLPYSTCVPKTGLNCTYPDLARGGAVPQSGKCTLYLYSTAGVGTATPTPPPSTGTPLIFTTDHALAPGETYAFAVGVAAPGFVQGYGIAICAFQNGTGYAEIWDNAGLSGGPGATLAYLAYIIPDPAFYHRSPAGDALGEFAIAPVNISKYIEKLLMFTHY